MGKMKNGSIVVTQSPLKILNDRTYLPVVLTVDIESNLPTLGAVQIIFDPTLVRLHAHCRSSLTNSASYLFTSSETTLRPNGSLGCRVQSGTYTPAVNTDINDVYPTTSGTYTSWILSGFAATTSPITLKIEGFIDILSSTTTGTGYFYGYTYASSTEVPLIDSGRFIDSYYHLQVPNTNIIAPISSQ
jgi:hypothetical protein